MKCGTLENAMCTPVLALMPPLMRSKKWGAKGLLCSVDF